MSNEPRHAHRTPVAIIGGAVLGTLAWLVHGGCSGGDVDHRPEAFRTTTELPSES
jgi:hypothetical protein